MSSKKDKGTCYFLGHSHLDAAWLWQFSETIRVFHDTCETVLGLMEKHPGFCFCQSSAQYYKWLEESYPETFEKVRRRVQDGRWELVGGTWIEPDGNLLSGESYVRQYLHGKRYFKRKFGIDVQVAWMPDSFGYAHNLPQIMKRSGMKYFLTSKMTWNDTTAFPYYFFKWVAPDGSWVYAHQSVGSYGETVLEGDISVQMHLLNSRQRLDDLLVLFGTGDHGGGVTREMVERASAYVEGKRNVKGVWTTAHEFFDTLVRRSRNKRIPEHDDEMYLQYHRGTYTTQSKTKRNNRRAECSLESAEKLSTIAQTYGCEYPRADLQDCWEKLLLNQFHDVLPGSAIPEVYDDSEKCFASIFSTIDSIISHSLDSIGASVDTSGEGRSLLIFNTLSWSRTAPVELPLRGVEEISEIYDDNGQLVPSQIIKKEGKLLFVADDVPSLGYREFKVKRVDHISQRTSTSLHTQETQTEIKLENEFIELRVEKQTGLIESIFDKREKMEILRGEGNKVQIFDDTPVQGRTSVAFPVDASIFDAWEIFIYDQKGGPRFSELRTPLDVTLLEDGPVRAIVRVRYKYAQVSRPDSLFVQDIILYHKIPLVEFRTHADWHAEHRLAKIAFPLSFHSDWTTYEAPYGFISRLDPSSPRATPSEKAKYEAPGQKWIDYSSKKSNIGVSLLNDGKYGFDVSHDVLRMTLLRSASFPIELRAQLFDLPVDNAHLYETTDQGEHDIAYALYPHSSDFKEALTVRRGCEFNYPLLVQAEPTHQGTLPKTYSFLSTQPDNIVLTVFKKAEESEDTILRLYEASGKHAAVSIRLGRPIKEAVETDLMENSIRKLPIRDGSIKLSLTKHEIRTIRIAC